jgi:hypothetical protein
MLSILILFSAIQTFLGLFLKLFIGVDVSGELGKKRNKLDKQYLHESKFSSPSSGIF